MFVKFLDDNDPRLLFLVTYCKSLETTYMKVVKIEKSLKAREISGQGDFNSTNYQAFETEPIKNLKRMIIEHQTKKFVDQQRQIQDQFNK